MATSLGMSCPKAFVSFVIVYIGTVSSLQWSNKQVLDPFLYLKDIGLVFRRSDDVCKICIGADTCVDIEEEKCNYYMETAAILQDEAIQPVPLATTTKPSLKIDIDGMLYGLADAVNNQNDYKDCIPYVSKYTNCNKENVCLGCKTCDCDASGRWNCSLVQSCRRDTLKMALDHRSLLVVLDNLRKEEINTNRVKRQIEKLSTPNLKHEEIQSLLSEWIYGVPPNLDEREDELADISDGTNEEEEELKSTTEKFLKFILHDPLYEVHDTVSEFDGNNNKVKRSIDESININTASNKDTFFNMNNSDIQVDLKETDLTDWLSNEKFLLGEFSDDGKYSNDEIRSINTTENVNGSDINKSNLNNVVSKIKSFAAQYNKNYEAMKEIRDKHVANIKSERPPLMDMSVLNDFIAKVFQNTTNETGLFSYINKDTFTSHESYNTAEKKTLQPLKDITNQDIRIEKPDKISSNKMKRSIDVYAANLNQINVKTDFNENDFLDKDIGNKNNLKELNNQDIKEWLNDQHPISLPSNETSITSTTTKDINFTIDGIIPLKDINYSRNDNNGYIRKKLPLNSTNVKTKSAETETFDMSQMQKISDDYMYDDDTVAYEDEFVEEKLYNFTGSEVTTVKPEYLTTTEAIETAVTEIVFDLLESAKHQLLQEEESKANDTKSTIKYVLDPVLEKNTMNIDNAIMKRDVSNTIEDNIDETTAFDHTTIENNQKTSPSVSDTVKDLMHDVLLPLNNILDDKQKELDELFKIKTGLVKFIKSSKNYDPALNVNFNNSKPNASHDRNSYFSIYRLEIVPNFDLDYKKTNVSILDRYMNKLKHDVYEVIRDIVGIQKMHSDPSKVPKDVRFLISALKQYVHKKGFHIKARNKNDTIIRRNMENFKYNLHKPNIKERIIKIIEFLDRDMPSENVLVGLSPTARKVMTRIYKTYYTDDFAIIGLRVHDPHYNLTNDLNNIGTKWDEITQNLHTGTPTSSLYKMKTLHQIISNDVSKMADALSLIDFARSRRMIPIDEHVGEGIITRINKDLQKIFNQLTRFSQEKEIKMLVESPQYILATPQQKKKKSSFITKLKKMLVNSKKDILSLIHKKVPKSDIVRELARKKLDNVTEKRMSEYKDTMTRWQEQLNVIPLRDKRSVNTDNIHRPRRMNNILPKYLRGKVPTNKTSALSSLRTKLRDKLKPVRESKAIANAKKIAPVTEKTSLNGTTTITTAKPSVYADPKPMMIVPKKTGVKTQSHQKTLKKFLKKSTKKTWTSKKATSKPYKTIV